MPFYSPLAVGRPETMAALQGLTTASSALTQASTAFNEAVAFTCAKPYEYRVQAVEQKYESTHNQNLRARQYKIMFRI